MTVRFECGCGVVEVYEKTGGRRRLRCEDCRVAAARKRAIDHYHAAPERHRRVQKAWVERNREAQRRHAREWAARNRANVTSNTQAYRARKLGAFVEHVDRDIVFVLHNGRCGICGKDTDSRDFHVDHIVPLSRGGEHSYANTQPAHPECNRRKNARLELTP